MLPNLNRHIGYWSSVHDLPKKKGKKEGKRKIMFPYPRAIQNHVSEKLQLLGQNAFATILK